jgi:peptide chain release factor 2
LRSRSIFDLTVKKDRLEALERQTLAPGFWNDAEAAQKVQKEHGQLQDVIHTWESRWKEMEDTELFLEMVMEEKDSEL